ncbi:hypothetical protein C0992_011081 [Termitomyces sp. T32_za158]|nr:hypothetical protein C0992_011081 [Termitomyces sp. T32_za158]
MCLVDTRTYLNAPSQLFWNIFLFCLGRHPLQTHNTIKPEIGKIPKSIVDSIPLVLYLPPPPDNIPQQQKVSVTRTDNSSSGTALPEAKKHFQFIKNLTSFNKLKKERTSETQEEKDIEKTGEPQTWEEHWEQGEHPFVILEENRATCAICLVDFAEPKRIWNNVKTVESKSRASLEPIIRTGEDLNPVARAMPVAFSGSSTQASNSASGTITRLTDAGEGIQPLRLLACGHVFHVSNMQIVFFISKVAETDFSVRNHALIHGFLIYQGDVQFVNVLLKLEALKIIKKADDHR